MSIRKETIICLGCGEEHVIANTDDLQEYREHKRECLNTVSEERMKSTDHWTEVYP